MPEDKPETLQEASMRLNKAMNEFVRTILSAWADQFEAVTKRMKEFHGNSDQN